MDGKLQKIIFLLVLGVCSISAIGQKTDTIVHINGNILLGEIKKLDDGIVTFKMDGMGTIKFQVDKVNTFSSEKNFQVTMNSGRTYYGKFDTSHTNRRVKLLLLNGEEILKIENIISLYPIRRNFWRRTSGVFSLGFNYSKGSGIANMTSSGKLDYRNRKTFLEFNWSQHFTFQGDTLNSKKSDIGLNMQRLLKRKWYFGMNVDGSTNSEMGYDFRLLGGASIINYLVQNYHNRLFISLGATGTREWVPEEPNPTDNLEALLGIQYHFFKFTDPEIHITTYVNTYPNITTNGRYRLNYYLDAKIEVINDFHLGVNFYYNFDSKPISETASKDDYGITTTISYSFN